MQRGLDTDRLTSADLYPIRLRLRHPEASNEVGHARKVVQQPGPLEPRGPQTLCVLRARRDPLDSDGSKAHDFEYRQ